MLVKKIGPEFASSIGRIEAQVYPPAFQLGSEDFREDLEEAEKDGNNFSFGIFQNSEMVGYLVAYKEGQKIYISDFAVLSACRTCEVIIALQSAFLKSASQAGLPFRAECRESTKQICLTHSDFFRANGYQLKSCQLLRCYNGGEDHWRIEFELISESF